MKRQDHLIAPWYWLEYVHLLEPTHSLIENSFDVGMNNKQPPVALAGLKSVKLSHTPRYDAVGKRKQSLQKCVSIAGHADPIEAEEEALKSNLKQVSLFVKNTTTTMII
jgi:hypothetical protein